MVGRIMDETESLRLNLEVDEFWGWSFREGMDVSS